MKVDKESSLFNLFKGRLTLSDKMGNKATLEAGQAVKATIVGFGAVTGFDENEVRKNFEEQGPSSTGNSMKSLLNGNAMLEIGRAHV